MMISIISQNPLPGSSLESGFSGVSGSTTVYQDRPPECFILIHLEQSTSVHLWLSR